MHSDSVRFSLLPCKFFDLIFQTLDHMNEVGRSEVTPVRLRIPATFMKLSQGFDSSWGKSVANMNVKKISWTQFRIFLLFFLVHTLRGAWPSCRALRSG